MDVVQEVQTLRLERRNSLLYADFYSLDHGPNHKVAVHDKPFKHSAKGLLVHELELIGMNHQMQEIMPQIRPDRLQSLTMINCAHLQYTLEALVRAGKLLKKVKAIFPKSQNPKGSDGLPINISRKPFYVQDANDKRNFFDFLRGGAFRLKDLEIEGQFTDEGINPRHLTYLSLDLFFAIQAHLESVMRLSIINAGADFTEDELVEIGNCTPRLNELRVQCRTGKGFIDHPSLNEGLGVSNFQFIISVKINCFNAPGVLLHTDFS
jgi:hypothetical protein